MVFNACFKCTERTVEPNCHSTCERYLAELEANEKAKQRDESLS